MLVFREGMGRFKLQALTKNNAPSLTKKNRSKTSLTKGHPGTVRQSTGCLMWKCFDEVAPFCPKDLKTSRHFCLENHGVRCAPNNVPQLWQFVDVYEPAVL